MTTSPTSPTAGEGSQTLERGLAVLVELGRHPEGLTTAAVATACGLHRSITNRLLISLLRTGFAVRDDAGLFTVGPAAASLVDNTRPRLRDVAEPALQRLARTVDATACLIEVLGGAAETTLVCEPPSSGPRFSYRLGNRDPLDRGAGGLAALASSGPVDGEPARIADIREAGYVITHAELNPGVHGVAAPIPGWPVAASIYVVTADPTILEPAVGPLLEAVAAIGTPAG